MNNSFSLNNILVLEAYKTDRGLRASVSSGFAMVEQKIEVKGLKLLMDANTSSGLIPKGSMAYIREELLHTQPWAQKILKSEAVYENFILVDMKFVEFIKPATT